MPRIDENDSRVRQRQLQNGAAANGNEGQPLAPSLRNSGNRKRELETPLVILFLPRLLLILSLAFSSLWLLLRLAARIPDLALPSSVQQVRMQAHNLKMHSDAGDVEGRMVLSAFCGFYLWKQTFAVPGSIFMNLLGGALYHSYALPLVCVLTAVGSSICYILSHFFGGPIIERLMPTRLEKMRRAVAKRRNDLFFYLLFIRMFPFTPNWFVNVSSPLVGVPLRHFFFSMLLGTAPYCFVTIQAGQFLSDIESPGDILRPSMALKLVAISSLALVPPLVGKKLKGKYQDGVT